MVKRLVEDVPVIMATYACEKEEPQAMNFVRLEMPLLTIALRPLLVMLEAKREPSACSVEPSIQRLSLGNPHSLLSKIDSSYVDSAHHFHLDPTFPGRPCQSYHLISPLLLYAS